MAFETLKGIVLRYVDYRENDRILTVLTRERGLITVTARACKKKNSPAFSVCEPCIYGEVVAYERGNMLYVSSATAIESFYPIREDYDKLVSVMQILHMTELLAYNRLPSEEIFALCYHSLSYIAYSEQMPIDIELCFAAKFLKLAGYTPVMTRCVLCGKDLRKQKELYFSKVQGGAMCDYCGAGCRCVSATTMEALRRMTILPLEDMRNVRLPEPVRKELFGIIYDYIEYVFEQSVLLRDRTMPI